MLICVAQLKKKQNKTQKPRVYHLSIITILFQSWIVAVFGKEMFESELATDFYLHVLKNILRILIPQSHFCQLFLPEQSYEDFLFLSSCPSLCQ